MDLASPVSPNCNQVAVNGLADRRDVKGVLLSKVTFSSQCRLEKRFGTREAMERAATPSTRFIQACVEKNVPFSQNAVAGLLKPREGAETGVSAPHSTANEVVAGNTSSKSNDSREPNWGHEQVKQRLLTKAQTRHTTGSKRSVYDHHIDLDLKGFGVGDRFAAALGAGLGQLKSGASYDDDDDGGGGGLHDTAAEMDDNQERPVLQLEEKGHNSDSNACASAEPVEPTSSSGPSRSALGTTPTATGGAGGAGGRGALQKLDLSDNRLTAKGAVALFSQIDAKV
jgi:hypothetical protein